jgi:hypothetical protein
MKNIYLVSTKESHLFYHDCTKKYSYKIDKYNQCKETKCKHPQHIYITSDEEIKEGDWFVQVNTKKIIKHHPKNGLLLQPQSFDKKIILTTDQDLIKNGVQAIDDEFLEWFVKNPSCEYIEVVYGLFTPMGRQVNPMHVAQNHSSCVWKYKIIIPKEEPKLELPQLGTKEFVNMCKSIFGGKPKQETILEQIDQNNPVTRGSTALVYKQETLEEAADNAFNDFKSKNPIVPQKHIFPYKLGYIEGAKWQAERMYSEEEVIAIVEKSRETGLTAEYLLLTEQFKKK